MERSHPSPSIPLPVEGRGKVEGDTLGLDREPRFATKRERTLAGRRSAFPSPLNGEREKLFPRLGGM
jgi:hypothetical protein